MTAEDPYLREARGLDGADPLAGYRAAFHLNGDAVYLDGNSLGRLPTATRARLQSFLDEEWGQGLVRSWSRWRRLPESVGDLVGSLIGAAEGQVILADSTSVNLYNLVVAAMDRAPQRRTIVTDDDNFPTDRYILEGVAARGGELRVVQSDPVDGIDLAALAAAIDESVAVVSLSLVSYRSGALAPMAQVTRLVHDAGALVLWDLSHAAGAVAIDIDDSGADLAVGCTYKYLNAGPGAPAFLYVRRSLQQSLRQPIWGWFGQRDQFAMGERYERREGIGAFLVGTPSVAGILAVETGAALLAEAGIHELRAKSVALTEFAVRLAGELLDPHGVRLASPPSSARRGAHVSFAHPDAWQITQALIAEHEVVPDFRTPDRVRFGLAPVYTRFEDAYRGVVAMQEVLQSGSFRAYPPELGDVT